MYVNRENEQLFVNIVKSGKYNITKEGKAFNTETGNEIGRRIHVGYYMISYKNKEIRLHRLVYLIHIGEIPDGYVVNHKDGNKLNNNVENLEAITVGDNNKHARKNGMVDTNKIRMATVGLVNFNRKFNENQVNEIKELYKNGVIQMEIARTFTVSKNCIRDILSGKNYNNFDDVNMLIPERNIPVITIDQIVGKHAEKEKKIFQKVLDGDLRGIEEGKIFNSITNRFIGMSICGGYYNICIKIDGKKYKMMVHRLIYMIFN